MSTKYEALKNKLNENETYSQVNLFVNKLNIRDLKTPFTRDRIRVVSTSSSVSLRSYLLLPLFL